jgi:hypothetical protein
LLFDKRGGAGSLAVLDVFVILMHWCTFGGDGTYMLIPVNTMRMHQCYVESLQLGSGNSLKGLDEYNDEKELVHREIIIPPPPSCSG